MKPIDRLILALPSFEQLEQGGSREGFWTGVGGVTAFEGALRLFASRPGFDIVGVQDWNASSGWRAAYGELAPDWDCVGEDAFGNQYLLSPDGDEIALFWSETGEVEMIGATPVEFIEMIRDDPANTISLPLYQECLARFGRLPVHSHFAFRVETAVGGQCVVDNVLPMKSLPHMTALGKLAVQLKDVPVGTRLHPIPE